MMCRVLYCLVSDDRATPHTYLLSLHDALPIWAGAEMVARRARGTPRIANRLLRRVRDYSQVKGDGIVSAAAAVDALDRDRKSTRLNSSHTVISYAVFCLKKKKKKNNKDHTTNA